MPINHAKCLQFRDTWAAPGSDLYAALEAGDQQKAKQIYDACEARLRKEQGPTRVVKIDITLRPEPCYSMCSLGVGCDEAGVCYAEAHDSPEQCGARKNCAPVDGVVQSGS